MAGETTTFDDGDSFSDSERMFWDSGGQKTEGLIESPKTTEPAKTEGAGTVDPAKTVEPPKTAEEGEIELDGENPKRDAKGRFVPVGVLHKAKDELRDTKARLATAEETSKQVAAILERFAKLAPAAQPVQQATKPEPEKLIDPKEDPLGAIEQERRFRIEEAKKREDLEKRTTEQIAAAEVNRVATYDIANVRSKDPADYDAAMRHLTKSVEAQYGLMARFRGPDGKPDTDKIRKAVAADVQNVVAEAIASNDSPGRLLYELAVNRGYQKRGAATVDPAKAAADAIASQAGSARTKAQEALETIGTSQEGSRSLANVGGGVTGGLTADAFLSMDEEEVMARLAANPGFQAEIDRALGRR